MVVIVCARVYVVFSPPFFLVHLDVVVDNMMDLILLIILGVVMMVET